MRRLLLRARRLPCALRLRRAHRARSVGRRGAAACLLAAFLLSACAEPPHKEMDQAQGAIDAARAAGAERYAQDEYSAATGALRAAHDAVGERDYRLALNHALESRERAQNAAAEAAETRARVRGEVERSMAAIQVLLAQAHMRLTAAEAATPRAALGDVKKEIAQLDAEVQEAGASMADDDYLGARPLLDGIKERIEEVTARIDEATTAQTQRRRR